MIWQQNCKNLLDSSYTNHVFKSCINLNGFLQDPMNIEFHNSCVDYDKVLIQSASVYIIYMIIIVYTDEAPLSLCVYVKHADVTILYILLILGGRLSIQYTLPCILYQCLLCMWHDIHVSIHICIYTSSYGCHVTQRESGQLILYSHCTVVYAHLYMDNCLYCLYSANS